MYAYKKDFLVTICLFYDFVYLECSSFHVFYWKTKKLLDILSFGVGRHNLLVSVLRHSAILLGDEKQRKRFWQWGEKNLKYHLYFKVFLENIFKCFFSTVPCCQSMLQSWKPSGNPTQKVNGKAESINYRESLASENFTGAVFNHAKGTLIKVHQGTYVEIWTCYFTANFSQIQKLH